MILRKLHLENYKQYQTLDLEFKEGLVGIIGRNGAGKSTLFEAILYCLYGKDESNKNLIRCAFADPKATVSLTLEFAVGPVVYTVRREYRGKAMAANAELLKNDAQIATGVAPVNDEIVRILNMERDAFKRSVFSGQKELSELSDTSGEARKRMVRKMIGLDTLDDIQSRINGDARELSSQIAGQRQNLLDPEVARVLEKDIAAQNKELRKSQKELKVEQKKLQAVESDYQVARKKFEAEEQKQKRHQSLQQEAGRLQERLEGLLLQQQNLKKKTAELQAQQEKVTAQEAEFSAYENDKKALQQLLLVRQKYMNRAANLAQLQELEPTLHQSRERIAELARLLQKKDSTSQQVQDKKALAEALEKSIEQKLEEFNQAKSQTEALAVRVDERRQKIGELQAIGKEGNCPTCFQPVLEAYDQVMGQLNQEIEALQGRELENLQALKERVRKEGLQLRQQLEGVKAEIQILLAEQTRLEEFAKQQQREAESLKKHEAQATRIQVVLREIGEVQFDENAYSSLKTRVEAQEARYLQYSNERAYLAREIPNTGKALQQAEVGATETQKNLQAQQADLQKTGYDAPKFEQTKQTLTQFGEAYSSQSQQLRLLEKSSLELQNQIAQKQGQLQANERIREQVSAKLAEVEVLKKLGELLNQFKTEILEKISPSISREASELFSRITKGKYERIQVDENFDFAIADGGLFYPIERFSGGEIDLANFCLRIAITKAIMDLSGTGQKVEFLAFDEIFGSQDEERRNEMMLALYYLQEQFRQIYIVTHIDSQKDYFPNILEVQFREEGSAISWW